MYLTIRKKLLLSNLANLCFTALLGGIGFFAMQSLQGAMQAVGANGHAMTDQLQADQMHDALRADILSALLAAQQGDVPAQQAAVKETAAHAARLRSLLKDLNESVTDAEIRQAIAQVQPDLETYVASALRIAALTNDEVAAAQNAYPQFLVHFSALEASMGKLSELIERDSVAAAAAGEAAADRARLLMMLACALAALAAFAVGHIATRSIVRPLDEAIGLAAHIADGDLSSRITVASTDRTETGRLKLALQNMQASLHQIVSQVRSGTQSMATASSEIASGNLDLSARTEQQASTLQETASSMEELTATVKHNGDNARQANALASSASDIALRGGAVVREVVSTMGAISASSARIVDIIGVIDGIAFQTNILALNAAVEAARAGEQGRGFAVVAQEVRTLAQRSSQAAKEIKTLIDDSVAQVGQGGKLVDQAGATMEEIVASVNRVTGIMGEISSASQEQEAGITQINRAVSDMDSVTQQNAALVEQAAAAAAALQDQAAQLAQVVGVFKLDAGQTTVKKTGTARLNAPRTAVRDEWEAI
ncbi:MAG TPA: methyl-accepting chemotaxis protein [Burkholderiaceae bacterium]